MPKSPMVAVSYSSTSKWRAVFTSSTLGTTASTLGGGFVLVRFRFVGSSGEASLAASPA